MMRCINCEFWKRHPERCDLFPDAITRAERIQICLNARDDSTKIKK